MSESHTKYWLNGVLDKIEERIPEREINISSGISPSASYHIGHFREILSADMIKVGLDLRGRQTKHLHVVDNFDPLRKRYDFLPQEYEKYVGWPVCLVPDPYNCCDSYADHFFNEFKKHIDRLNIDVEVVKSYEDLYRSGKMAPQIEKAVEKVDTIKDIFAKVSNRQLEDDWMPLQLLSDDNSFDRWRYKSIDTQSKTIKYIDENNQEGQVSYTDGRVKLNWRLDWPARWQLLNVMVEPHGAQEHGASGGSYQTGLMFAREVFGFEGPIAGIQYGHIHLSGDNIKMSSSKGNIVTPEQVYEIMPPEMIRYFYLRYPGKKKIDFDPGLGLFRMMDEYSAVDRDVRAGKDNEFSSAYQLANVRLKKQSMSSIPFSHLVTIYQSALKDEDKVFETLARNGYQNEVNSESEAIKNELTFVANWLDKWAPDEIKFELNQSPVELSDKEKAFLETLAGVIKSDGEGKDGLWYHEQIHKSREEVGLSPQEAFEAVYKTLIGKTSGPKAGWFLSILDRDYVVNRFKHSL